MTDLRQAATLALEFLMTRRLGAEAVIESLNEALAREHAMHDLARLGQELVCDKDPQGCWNVRCQLGKKCKNTPPAAPVQEPVVSLPYHPCTQILIAGLKDLHAWDVLHEWDKARKIVDDGMVATTPPAAQPEQEPCIGKDPRCPCQDGGACHYKDCGNTKARTVPPAQPEQGPVAWAVQGCSKMWRDEFAEIDAKAEAKRIGGTCVAYALYTTPPSAPRKWQGLTDEDVNKESIMIASKMKLAFHAGMYVAQNILKERNT
jgi:hypothetical protein